MTSHRTKALFLVLSLCLVCACANQHKRIVPTQRRPLYRRPLPKIENRLTSPASVLVDEGIAELKKNDVSTAEWKFEEAINLDPDYGPAYYWLARARYRLQRTQEALDLLNQAQKILKNSKVWLERIEKFRNYLWELNSL